MDFNQLHTFYHVARLKNFTRASEELLISQPAVSRQIEGLEKSLGLPLFYRVRRQIELTEAGHVLFQQAEQILSLVQKTRSAIDSLKNAETGSLRVGASTTIGNYFLAPVILKFMEQYPGLEVSLEIKSSREIRERIKKDIYDIAILPDEEPLPYTTRERLLQDDVVLIAPSDSPLLLKKEVRLADLQAYPMLLRGSGSNTRETIEAHFKNRGVSLPKTIELGSTEAIKQAVKAGGGISFLSEMTIQNEVDLGVIRIVDGEELRAKRWFYIVQHEDSFPTPAVQRFVTFLKEMVA